MTELQQKIKNEFDKQEAKLNAQRLCKYHQIRKKAMNEFLEIGLPTLKHEDWKYTNVAFLNKIDFHFADEIEHNFDESFISQFKINDLQSYLIVLINGIYSKELSDNVSENGIEVMSLKSAIELFPNVVEKDLGLHLNFKNHAFASINTAFSFDGLYIEIDDNIKLSKPIHIININDSREKSLFINPRKLVKVGKSSDVVILETNHTLGDNLGITNTAAEILLDKNSHVDYYKLQDDSQNSIYFSFTQAVQQRDSSFNDNTVTLHGKFVRNNLSARQEDSNCETFFNGFFYTDGKQFVDNHTFVDHANPNCYSDEFYKGIIDEQSTAVFNGRILVRPDAQKINAYQSNKNVLLSNDATINTKPELEIYADDVKCSHGATSGSLNKDELFYLIARGINQDKAKAMLLNAFANEIIERIKLPEVREIIVNRIENRLENKLVQSN